MRFSPLAVLIILFTCSLLVTNVAAASCPGVQKSHAVGSQWETYTFTDDSGQPLTVTFVVVEVPEGAPSVQYFADGSWHWLRYAGTASGTAIRVAVGSQVLAMYSYQGCDEDLQFVND